MSDHHVSPSSSPASANAPATAPSRVPSPAEKAPIRDRDESDLDNSTPKCGPMPVVGKEPAGDESLDHVQVRLACLREAREQAGLTRMRNYADILFRARTNARFVLFGITPGLRLRNENDGSDTASTASTDA